MVPVLLCRLPEEVVKVGSVDRAGGPSLVTWGQDVLGEEGSEAKVRRLGGGGRLK